MSYVWNDVFQTFHLFHLCLLFLNVQSGLILQGYFWYGNDKINKTMTMTARILGEVGSVVRKANMFFILFLGIKINPTHWFRSIIFRVLTALYLTALASIARTFYLIYLWGFKKTIIKKSKIIDETPTIYLFKIVSQP